MAFIWCDRPLVHWPIECKVLATDRSLRKYVQELRTNYLIGRYAPVSGMGAMLGYLKRGEPNRFFAGVEKALDCPLAPHPTFSPTRSHRVSDHERPPHAEWKVSRAFRCHHLILPLRPSD